MLEKGTVGDQPAIVGDKSIANRWSGDGRGEEAGDESGPPRRYSHSIVAGGLELTS